MKFHIDTKYLLALAFIAAAVGASTVCAICLALILFVATDKSHISLGCDALVLCFADNVISAVLNIVTLLFRLIGLSTISTVVSSSVSIISGIVGIAVLVIGLMAAKGILKGETVSIPIVGGKFSGIVNDI